MRLRLILSFLLIALVSITSVVLIARQGAISEVRNFMFRGGMSGLNSIAAELEDYFQEHGNWEGVSNVIHAATSSPGRGPGGQGGPMGGNSPMLQNILLADSAGKLVASSQGETPGRQLSQAEIDNAIHLEVNDLTVGFLIPQGGARFTQAEEALLVGRLNRAALIAGLIAGGLALLLALWLAYRLLIPVRALTTAAKRLASGSLSQRVAVHGQDELALLAKTFNQMAASLQQAEESRRALTADIAHELRNPLAVQRANLEALQDGIYPLKPETIQPVLEQNLLLTRLVNDLQILTLADMGQLVLEKTSEDLASLAEGLMEHYRTQAQARHIRMVVRSDSHCRPVYMDTVRVEQILGNLLSNALRYTPDKGQISLSLLCLPDAARLEIYNTGESIAPEVLPYIFDRFYRGDKSRTRSEGGTGLGLSIARKLAEAHGGTLTAANHPENGVVFTLTLPYGEP